MPQVFGAGSSMVLGDIFAQIDRLAAGQWHVTVTKLLRGKCERDETIPVIDLGIFPTTTAARAAAHLVLNSWDDGERPPGVAPQIRQAVGGWA